MFKINLTNGFFIEVDDLNHTLKQRFIGKDKDGNAKESERVCGYFGKDIGAAIGKYIRLNQNALLAQEAIEMEEYIKSIERINKDAVRAFKALLAVCEDEGKLYVEINKQH